MDKRKNNGGHSTKTTGVDKRKNTFRESIESAVSAEQLIELLYVAISIAKSDDKDRMQAINFVYDRIIGKPKQEIDQKTELSFPKIDMNNWK